MLLRYIKHNKPATPLCCLPHKHHKHPSVAVDPRFTQLCLTQAPGEQQCCARAFLRRLPSRRVFLVGSCIVLGQMTGIFFGSLEFSVPHQKVFQTVTRWWFQMFVIFTPTSGNTPIWPNIWERGVETTNHVKCSAFFWHPQHDNMIDILIVGNLSLDEAVAVARVSPLQLKRILKAGARTTQKVMQQGKRSVELHESHHFPDGLWPRASMC